MPASAATKKEKVVIFVSAENRSRLWDIHAKTRRPVSEIANAILDEHFARKDEATQITSPS